MGEQDCGRGEKKKERHFRVFDQGWFVVLWQSPEMVLAPEEVRRHKDEPFEGSTLRDMELNGSDFHISNSQH